MLISNKTKVFSDNFELKDIPKISFSTRAEGVVELLFCTGWNPYNYPCYYFNMDYREIYFKLYQTLPRNNTGDYKKNNLQVYKVSRIQIQRCRFRDFLPKSIEFQKDLAKIILAIFKRILMRFFDTRFFNGSWSTF